ncbi:MAG: winged helix DNA-binding domain-containing protein [Arcanobacterium sp.]|nr:winged helix DNA-binding domain-containing protein [Arcanobacterium sp.]
MKLSEFLSRRLIAQSLAPSAARPTSPSTIAEAAKYMLATQGQNYAGGLTALAIRAGLPEVPLAKNTSHLDSAMDNYEVIRTWSQRGTLHYLHPSNFWLVTLLGPRSIGKNTETLAREFGVELTDYDTAFNLLYELCPEPISRQTLRELFRERGFDNRFLAHHLRRSGSLGSLIQTKRNGSHDVFTRSISAIPEAVAFAESTDDEQKLNTLVLQYFSTRGPATIADLAWWSGLAKGTLTKQAAALVSTGELLEFEWAGSSHFMGAWQEHVTNAELNAALELSFYLPAFDEYFIAYKDRKALFAPGVDPLSVMTKNGLSWPFRVEAGLIVGTDKNA